jgi:hypothetical protein
MCHVFSTALCAPTEQLSLRLLAERKASLRSVPPFPADLRVSVCVCARIKNKLDPAAAASAGDFRLHAADKVGLL